MLYGPWLLFNLIESGSPLQDSGSAIRFLSLAYASYFGYGPENMALSGPDFSFVWAHVVHSLRTLKVIPPVHVIFRSIEKAGILLDSLDSFRLAGSIIGILFLAGTGFAIGRWRQDPRREKRHETNFLLLLSGLLLLSYSLYVFGAFFFLRYFYPVYLVGCVYLAFLLQDLFDWYRRRSPAVRRAVISGAVIYTLLFSFFSYSQAFRSRPVYPFYDVAKWLQANTSEDETIGVFQSGAIGYFCDRRVINLDGKVNREALTALRKGCLVDYLRDSGIDIVVDHCKILEIFLGSSPYRKECSCTKIPPGKLDQPSGWVALRPRPLPVAEGRGGKITGGTGTGSAPSLWRDR